LLGVASTRPRRKPNPAALTIRPFEKWSASPGDGSGPRECCWSTNAPPVRRTSGTFAGFAVADVVVFGWGPVTKLPPALRWRWLDVYRMAIKAGHIPLCFGVCNDGHPRHPLMTPYEQPPMIWDRPNG
jgi:hypothetical protein